MIADFVSIKAKLRIQEQKILRDEMKKRTPLINLIGKHVLHEGHGQSVKSETRERSVQLMEARAEFQISTKEMAEIKIPEIFKKLSGLADQMASQIEGGMFQTIFKDLEEAEQTLTPRKLDGDAILEALEKIQIDFENDDREKPTNLSLFVHPDLLPKLMEQESRTTAEERAEFEAKRKIILDKKFEEFKKREGERRIVD